MLSAAAPRGAAAAKTIIANAKRRARVAETIS
jgi:hypothetical protein